MSRQDLEDNQEEKIRIDWQTTWEGDVRQSIALLCTLCMYCTNGCNVCACFVAIQLF